MSEQPQPIKALERMPTGVPGLDVILRGGLLRGGIYILMGPPGVGKTTLGANVCFHQAKSGGGAVYLTLLAETSSRMVLHLQGLAFFDPAPIGTKVQFVSGYRTLASEGLAGLLTLLRRVVRDSRATLLVVDGLATVEAFAESGLAFKRFIHELRSQLEMLGCTTLLLTESGGDLRPADPIVDGVIELSYRAAQQRLVRELTVRKFRGSSHVEGVHTFAIGEAGLIVHPRTEALLNAPPPEAKEKRQRLGFGVPGLDAMLRGGLLSGSTTVVLGAPGTGKTLLGLHFVAANARRRQPALHFGFYETPPRLVAKAQGVGLRLGPLVERGAVEILWQAPLEQDLDALADQLLDAIERRRVRRLFLDGLTAFAQATVYPDRLTRFFTALTNELRARDVTTVVAVETRGLFTDEVEPAIEGFSAVVENIVYLRYVEHHSQLQRLISILKARESDHDTTIRQFTIGRRGIEVVANVEDADPRPTGRGRRHGPPARPDGA